MNTSVCVIGAGSWGTALAMVLARQGRSVRLFARDPAKAARMQQVRENDVYLPGVSFPESLEVTSDLNVALDYSQAVVIATPSSAAESVLPQVAKVSGAPVIAAFKGLHPDTLERTDELLVRHLGTERSIVLSGPSFAMEVARGLPTAMTMAASDIKQAEAVALFFADTNFRIYASDDPAGVSLGGALKNVVAIAAGMANGMQLGHNAVAAVITRGLAEMARIACACGGRRETLMGLSGLGDLVLTCTGELSRNRRFGIALAQGMDVAGAEAHIGQVVEGLGTAYAIHALAARLEVEAPLMESVYQVLRGNLRLTDAVQELMTRPERKEF